MANIMRYDPFRELWDVRNMMDRIFDDTFNTGLRGDSTRTWGLPMDVVENENEYIVKASIPGVHPDDLDVTYNNNILTVSGEVKGEQETEDTRYHLRERRFGKFSRSIQLPNRIEADKIEAQYESGELILHLPKSDEVKPKRISIHSGGEKQKMLEGRFNERAKN